MRGANNLSDGRIGVRDKLGYALGDVGGLLTFSLVSSFLQMFYSDVLRIPLGKITTLMLAARIWDAFNDPLWGGFIDSRRPTRYGRFRPYILGASVPLAIAAVLMFTSIPGLTPGQSFVFASVTYIFYGMMYTGTNIPYGALASAVTGDPAERSSLSVWRSVGAGLGGLPALILLPMLVYSTNASTGVKYLDAGKLSACVAVLAVLSLVVFFLHFRMTTERITVADTQKPEGYNFFGALWSLLRNRPFLSISLASMLLIASQMYTQTIYNYLFKDYFAQPNLYLFVTICTYLPMGLLLPFMGKLVRRFGKRALCGAGMAFAALVNFAMYAAAGTAAAKSPILFLVMLFFSGFGQTFLTLQVWAMVMDVTDYHEYRCGRKEEGTVYSVYNFIRKIGHTIAGAGSSAALLRIGYDVNAVQTGQSAQVIGGFFTLATLIPALMFAAMAALLLFGYNLSGQKLESLHAKKTAEPIAAADE